MPRDDMPRLELDPDRDAWERQPKETLKRFGQFTLYRDLGRTRTLRKVSETLSLNDGYLRQVASAYQWNRRAEQHDLHLDGLHQAQWLEQRRKAAEADATMLHAFLVKVGQRLQMLNPESMEVPDLIRALDVLMRHRRALFGDPQMTIAVTGPAGDPLTVQLADFAGMPAEQRRKAILALTDDVRRRAEAPAGLDDDDE